MNPGLWHEPMAPFRALMTELALLPTDTAPERVELLVEGGLPMILSPADDGKAMVIEIRCAGLAQRARQPPGPALAPLLARMSHLASLHQGVCLAWDDRNRLLVRGQRPLRGLTQQDCLAWIAGAIDTAGEVHRLIELFTFSGHEAASMKKGSSDART